MKITEPGRRLVGCAFFIAAISFYVLLLHLGASSAGHGTHMQLGLPACSYLARTHYPCPGCGVTTAAACMARGRAIEALHGSVFGVFAFLAIMTLGIAGLVQVLTGRNVLRKFKPGPWAVLAIIILFLVSWGLKTGLGVWEGRYPIK